MSFALFYLLALIPLVVGGLLWWFNHRYNVWEWIVGAALAFIVAGVMHYAVSRGMTADEEVWSGEVRRVEYRPEWRERYQEAIYRTVHHSSGSGKTRRTWTTRVFSHYETRYTTHPDRWTAYSNIGQELPLSRGDYNTIVKQFGQHTTTKPGSRSTMKTGSTMVSGDRNDYVTANETSFVLPTVMPVAFENRVKASPSVFSYAKLTEDEEKRLFDYPVAGNPWRSQRVLSAPIDIVKWDQMMAKLGPTKRVNLIIAQLPNAAEARKLEAKWVGGKKNDLVITYGPGWSYVFGWSEDTRVKRELESLLVEKPGSDAILPDIDRIVRAHYKPVDWHKFDYLDLEPAPRHVAWLIAIMAATQAGFIIYGLKNDHDKQPKPRFY